MRGIQWIAIATIGVAAAVGTTVAVNHPPSPESPSPVASPSPTSSPSPAQTPTPTVPSSPVASPSPTPSPTPTPAPLSERSPITLRGLGSVQIGMTVDDASTAAGVDLVGEDDAATPGCRYFKVDELRDVGFMETEGTIARVDVWNNPRIKTVSGFGIGSTEADIQAQFPGQIEIQPHEYTDGHYVIFVPQDGGDRNYRIVFETDRNGRVVQFRAGRLPEVLWIEGCA